MNMLARWNPFKSGTSPAAAMQEFDDFFRGLATRNAWHDMDLAPDIRIDVGEDDKRFQIKAEVPGVSKEDISITVDGNLVSISAEVKRDTENRDSNRLYSERNFGKAFRSFSLPCEVDQAKAEARYEKGILSLMLPKRPNGSARKIAVS